MGGSQVNGSTGKLNYEIWSCASCEGRLCLVCRIADAMDVKCSC